MERAAQRALDEGRPVRELLLTLPEVMDAIGENGLDAALAPESYLGAASELIDRALAAHRA